MGLVPFYSRFRTIAFQEMQSMRIQENSEIPDGNYGFLEFYCDDPVCDCQRVLIHIIEEKSGRKVWASINYGWADPTHYQRWMGDRKLAKEASGLTLDPLNPQTPYAPAFFRLFESIIQENKEYTEMLKRHYQMFKNDLNQGSSKGSSKRPLRPRKKIRRRP